MSGTGLARLLLQKASGIGEVDVMQLLLSRGADVNAIVVWRLTITQGISIP